MRKPHLNIAFYLSLFSTYALLQNCALQVEESSHRDRYAERVRQNNSSDQENKNTPFGQGNKNTPSGQEKKDTPSDQEKKDTPSGQEKKDTPSGQENQDTSGQEKKDTPSGQEKQDTSGQEKQDTSGQETPNEGVVRKWSKKGDSLIFNSRDNADVALYVEFDDDINQEKFEQQIKKAIETVADNYCHWSINVTTDKEKARQSRHWAWMLVEKGGSSGRAGIHQFNRKGSKGEVTANAGSDSVLKPDKHEGSAYLITHEFGHNFGLRGTTDDYSGPKPGAFMGGRSSRYQNYIWRDLKNKKGVKQNPSKYIQKYARLLDSSQKHCP